MKYLVMLCLIAGVVSAAAMGAPLNEAVTPNENIATQNSKIYTGYYRLNPGDVIEVMVWENPQFRKQLTVDPDGNVHYLFIGTMPVAGFTISEVKSKMKDVLSRFITAPTIEVIPISLNSMKYTLLGMVGKPGIYATNGTSTVLDVIARAGGLKSGVSQGSMIDLADLDRAMLVRQGKLIPVDFKRLLYEGALTQNVKVENADLLYIPSRTTRTITLMGYVNSNGVFGYTSGMTLVKTVIQNGGFHPDADRHNVVILRGSLSNPLAIRVNAADIMEGRANDEAIYENDIIYIHKYEPILFLDIAKIALETFVQRTASVIAEKLIYPRK